MNNAILGIHIKFKPIVGNLEHIKIVEKLGELHGMYKLYKKWSDEGVEDGKKGKKLIGEIRGMETSVQGMIIRANEKTNAK